MPTFRNTTSPLNTFPERLTLQQMNYHDHQMQTKEKTTTKIKHSLNQNYLSIPSVPHISRTHPKRTSWPSSTTTPPQDTQDKTRQSGKRPKPCHGWGCANG